MPPSDPARRHWEKAAGRLAARINAVTWLERFAPAAFGVGSAAASTLYALRRLRHPDGPAWLVLACGLGLAALAAWRPARRAFFARSDARVLLEYQLRLDAALSAAAAGVGPWPGAGAGPVRILRWRAGATLGWLAAAGVVIAAGQWLPVPAAEGGTTRPVEPPPALAETEAWLRDLRALDVAQPESVAALEARAQELAARSPEDQYSHSALEAADTLRDQTADALRRLARALEAGAGSLEPLADPQARPDDAQLRALGNQLAAALSGLRAGELSPRADLLRQLAGVDAAGLRNLTAAQAAQLARRLGAAGQGVRGIPGAMGAGAPIAAGTQPGGMPGAGGPGGGGPPAPLAFKADASDAGAGRMQAVTNPDLSRAALGDLLDTQRGAHEVDPTKALAPVAAGAVAAPAAGGEAVWVNRLTPGERAVLKDFFQ